ncbi:hypothetical protein HY745_11600 [Candidatus Desantisbacteria bacterium]|nr:hypothetical protein [Candidatus Desantisbacteria bacterium]
MRLLVSHYDIQSAITQKIEALAGRAVVQARDIFDLYILSSQTSDFKNIEENKLKIAQKNIFRINFEEFRDSVVSYLALDAILDMSEFKIEER